MFYKLLCISLLVGICLAGTPQQKAPAALEPRMTEISKLSQQIKAAAKAADPEDDEDCNEPPPRRCRQYIQHDPKDPNSPGWVRAKDVGQGQLPDDLKAKLPQWIKPNTVKFLPEEPSSSGDNGSPCCVCPQCGLSFYTPNDYWGHIPSCPVPSAPKTCTQTSECLGNSHFDSDPRVCMCRPGPASSSSVAGVTGSSTGVTGISGGSSGLSLNDTSSVNGTTSSSGLSLNGTASSGLSVNGTSGTASAGVSSGVSLSGAASSTVDLSPPSSLNGSLIATGSIGDLSGSGPFLDMEDVEAIAQQVGEQVADAIGSGTDQVLLGP